MVAIGSVIAGITNIVLNFIFITLLGYLGAAIATVLSNIVLVIVHTCFAKKLVKDKWVYNVRMFAPAVIGLIKQWYYIMDFMISGLLDGDVQ